MNSSNLLNALYSVKQKSESLAGHYANKDTIGFQVDESNIQAVNPSQDPEEALLLPQASTSQFKRGQISQQLGEFETTKNKTDAFINGAAFYFRCVDSQGNYHYTRNGQIRANEKNELEIDGKLIDPSITKDALDTNLEIDSQGNITATDANGTIKTLGTVTLSKIPGDVLERTQGSFFKISSAEDFTPEVEGQPGTSGIPELVNQAVEKSNVSDKIEIQLVKAYKMQNFLLALMGTQNEIERQEIKLISGGA